MPTAQKVRVRIYYNDGSYADITDRLKRGPEIKISEDADDWEVSTLTFSNTANEITQGVSLDPWDENSSYNQNNGEYEPLLAWYHKIKIWAQDVDQSWNLRFEGFCGSGDVRTWIQVVYKDTLSGDAEKLSDPVTDEDAKEKYGIWKGNDIKGHRKMRMVEDNESWIDIEGEAVTYANSALHDLAVMKPEMNSVIANDRRGEVSLKPYGRSQPYKDDKRLTKYHYEDRDLATSLLESILIDSNFQGRMKKIVIEDDPSVEIGKFVSADDESTWRTLQRAVKKAGYELTLKKHSAGVSYNDGSGETTPEEGFYLTLIKPDRDKTTADVTYPGSIVERRSEPGRGQIFQLSKDIFDNIGLYDMVEFDGSDYTTRLGVTTLTFNWSPSSPWGETTVEGVADKVIGDSTYWTAQDITEEERNKRRNNFYQGEIKKLPKPKNLKIRSYPTQAEDGQTIVNIVATWKQPKAWWYDHTEVWVSVDKQTRFGNNSYATTRINHIELKPFPTGEDIWVKIRHIPDAQITEAGRR